MKKPSLAQTLKNFQKKQVQKAKSASRDENTQRKQQSVDRQANQPAQPAKKDIQKPKPLPSDDFTHVPCHIWTEGNYETRTPLPFHPNGTSGILLCGEGDFSYCLSLAKSLHQRCPDGTWYIIATALDAEETVKQKYRRAVSNLNALASGELAGRVTCLFGVDAALLHENREIKRVVASKSGPLTRIIFNFPHTGAGIKDRERNIVAQQRLLLAFFSSVCKSIILPTQKTCSYTTTMVKKHHNFQNDVQKQKPKPKTKENDDDDDDEKVEAVVEEEGDYSYTETSFQRPETFQCHVTLKTGDPYDAWNIKSMALKASEGKLALTESFRFLPQIYPGYQHCRTIGEHRGDLESDAVIDSDGWKDFLAGKPAKTFVFEFKPPKKE